MHSYTRRFMQASPQIHNPVGLIPETASDVYHTRKCLDCITGGRGVKKRKNVLSMIPQSYALQLLTMPPELSLLTLTSNVFRIK
jgi:hypothetical protein